MTLATTLQYSESNLVGILQDSIGKTDTSFTVVFKDRVTNEQRDPQSTTKLFVIDKGNANSPNPNYEIVLCSSHSTTSGITTLSSVTRGLEFSGVGFSAVTARKKPHIAGAEVGVVELHYYNNAIVATLNGVGDVYAMLKVADHTARDADITAAEGQIIYVNAYECFEQYRDGVWWLIDPVFADSTTRDTAIPSPVNGMSCYNTAEGVEQAYIGGSWTDRGTSTTPNSSTTVAGKNEEATDAEVGASTETGGTGARLYINPASVIKDGGDAAENKLVALGSNTKFPSEVIPNIEGILTPEGRLTFTSGVPVQNASNAAYTTLYYTPYTGNKIALYDGSSEWVLYTFSEISLSLSGLTADTNYDIYIYDNSGTLTLEAAATGGTTTQNGIYVQSGATTKRYLGTIRTNSTGGQSAWVPTTAPAQLFLYNFYNQVEVYARFSETSGGSGTVSTRAWNNDTDNSLEFVSGLGVEHVYGEAVCRLTKGGTDLAALTFLVGIGLDSSSSNAVSRTAVTASGHTYESFPIVKYDAMLGSGNHVLYITETGTSTGANSGSWANLETRFVLHM